MKQKEQNNTGKQIRGFRRSEESKRDRKGIQCEEIETCQNKNNSKRAYQLMKDK